MVQDYYIQVEVEIQDGILSPEKVKEAKSKIPDGYKAKLDKPEIRIDGNVAKLLFYCTAKGSSSGKIVIGKNPPSKNSY